MVDHPKISVILPIFNIPEEYLVKCIESLLCQTEHDFEMILVDDGSTNNAYEVCIRYAREDERVRVLRQQNEGVSVARNNGLAKARGDWVCFVDPDDWAEDRYLERLYEAAWETKADIVLCDCLISAKRKLGVNRFLDQESGYLDEEERNRMIGQLLSKSLAHYYPPYIAVGVPWAKMFKRSFLDGNSLRFIPGMRRMQDNIFCLYAFEAAKTVYYLNAPLYVYRREIVSVSSRYNSQIMDDFEKYFSATDVFLDAHPAKKSWQDAFNMKKLTSVNSYIRFFYYNDESPFTKEEAKLELSEKLSREPYKSILGDIKWQYLRFSEKVFVFFLKHGLYSVLDTLIRLRSYSEFRSYKKIGKRWLG